MTRTSRPACSGKARDTPLNDTFSLVFGTIDCASGYTAPSNQPNAKNDKGDNRRYDAREELHTRPLQN